MREVQWAQEERIFQDGERIRELERSVGTLRTLINSLVETVGLVQNDVAWIHHRFVNNQVNRWAECCSDQVQMLVEHEGRLIPIEEPIDLAERRPTPHPSQIIDLTDDSDDMMLGSLGLSGPLYPKLSMCIEGTWLTQLVQVVTAGRLFLGHKGRVNLYIDEYLYHCVCFGHEGFLLQVSLQVAAMA